MTKIPSVEERVEDIANKIAKETGIECIFGTGVKLNQLSKNIITQALIADRSAILNNCFANPLKETGITTSLSGREVDITVNGKTYIAVIK